MGSAHGLIRKYPLISTEVRQAGAVYLREPYEQTNGFIEGAIRKFIRVRLGLSPRQNLMTRP